MVKSSMLRSGSDSVSVIAATQTSRRSRIAHAEAHFFSRHETEVGGRLIVFGALLTNRGLIPFLLVHVAVCRRHDFRAQKNGSHFCHGRDPKGFLPNTHNIPVQENKAVTEPDFTQ